VDAAMVATAVCRADGSSMDVTMFAPALKHSTRLVAFSTAVAEDTAINVEGDEVRKLRMTGRPVCEPQKGQGRRRQYGAV
jgi:hypothetical protein